MEFVLLFVCHGLPSLCTFFAKLLEHDLLVRILLFVLFSADLDEESVGRHPTLGLVLSPQATSSQSFFGWHLLCQLENVVSTKQFSIVFLRRHS